MQPLNFGVPGVALAVLDPKNRVVGNGGLFGDSTQIARAAIKLGDDLGQKVCGGAHGSILGTNALCVKAQMPICYIQDGAMGNSAASVLADNLTALMAADTEVSSQPRLAKKAGLDQKTIWRIVNQVNSPTIEAVEALAGVFKVAAWQLIHPAFKPIPKLGGGVAVLGMPGWPFTTELRERVEALDEVALRQAENVLRAMVGMPTLSTEIHQRKPGNV